MIYIYFLKLEDNKYYVGKTTNPQFRLENHFCSTGAEWTKKYTPLKLHELRPDQSNHDEQRITQELLNFDNKKLYIKTKKSNKISLISGPYNSITLMKNDYIQLKKFGFEELDISINE